MWQQSQGETNMRRRDCLIALATAALALSGCATARSSGVAPAYYVMRHLEKADGPDPALSATGAANAARLADWFKGRAKPGAIYVSTTRRARETAAPLAARLGLTPKEYNPADTAALVARVRAEPGSVLIVGHSNTVPDIVAVLGGARPEPIADAEYGAIWMVTQDGRAERLAL
jgi:phosphohistidine phosphatase SixA